MTIKPETNRPEEARDLRQRILAVGRDLGQSLAAVTSEVEGSPEGPNRLARSLGLDKVFTSRLLKTLRDLEPAHVLHSVPGPMPLRRFLSAARRKGVPVTIVDRALAAVDHFERLIQDEVGDRSSLGAILSVWLPGARAEFELRRKQAAFKAMSELKGYATRLDLSAAFLYPSANGNHLDVVWLIGLMGLQRLRPGVRVKLSSRRIAPQSAERRPRTLAGEVLEGTQQGLLEDFSRVKGDSFTATTVTCGTAGSSGPQTGADVVHYTLDGTDFGAKHDVDLLFAEVNEGELPRYVDTPRKGYAFSDISVPAKTAVFDLFVHKDVYPGQEPELILYDTAIDGIADVNDRSRDLDRLDMSESIDLLGSGLSRIELPENRRYRDLVQLVHSARGWNAADFRGFRSRIEYPLYGSQIVMAFDASVTQT